MLRPRLPTIAFDLLVSMRALSRYYAPDGWLGLRPRRRIVGGAPSIFLGAGRSVPQQSASRLGEHDDHGRGVGERMASSGISTYATPWKSRSLDIDDPGALAFQPVLRGNDRPDRAQERRGFLLERPPVDRRHAHARGRGGDNAERRRRERARQQGEERALRGELLRALD